MSDNTGIIILGALALGAGAYFYGRKGQPTFEGVQDTSTGAYAGTPFESTGDPSVDKTLIRNTARSFRAQQRQAARQTKRNTRYSNWTNISNQGVSNLKTLGKYTVPGRIITGFGVASRSLKKGVSSLPKFGGATGVSKFKSIASRTVPGKIIRGFKAIAHNRQSVTKTRSLKSKSVQLLKGWVKGKSGLWIRGS